MPYTQFVQTGRVALISFGTLSSKLAVIVDIVDDKRVMIDVVGSEEPRQSIPIKRLKLTDIVIPIARAAERSVVKNMIESENVVKKFNETKWGKRLETEKHGSELNDFQRFKHQKLVAKRDEMVKQILAKH